MRKEVENCWRQAQEDYKTARINADVGRYYASVFFCQQSAEKALKALYIHVLKELPQTHNLIELAKGLKAPGHIIGLARELNPKYLTTRYVDAANGVPADMFDKKSARTHLKYAKDILTWTKEKLK